MLRGPVVSPLSGNTKIGGEVQLAATEFAHPQNDEGLRFTSRVARAAVGTGELPRGKAHRRIDSRIGKAAGIGEGLLQRRIARQVAPGDAHHFAQPLLAQSGHESVQVRRVAERRLEPLRNLLRFRRACQLRLVNQPSGQRRVTGQGFADEIAAGENARQRRTQFRRRRVECRERSRVAHARQLSLTKRAQVRCHRRGL